MQPYYEDAKSGIVIYCGDNREILPRLERADLLATDPPYGVGADGSALSHRRGGTQRGKALAQSKDYGVGNWDKSPPPDWMFGLMLEKCRWAVIWGGNYFSLPPSKCWLVWDKDNGNNGYADCELAWTNLDKAVRKTRYRWMGMLQEHAGEDKEPRFHATQKPLEIMRWSILQAPDDCLTIIDPYMGSGTTLRAAKDLGRKAIGIEISEAYCEIAANRLSQGVLQFSA